MTELSDAKLFDQPQHHLRNDFLRHDLGHATDGRGKRLGRLHRLGVEPLPLAVRAGDRCLNQPDHPGEDRIRLPGRPQAAARKILPIPLDGLIAVP